jgi:hypothetical protein
LINPAEQLPGLQPLPTTPTEEDSDIDRQAEQSALQTYAEDAARLGEKINAAAEEFAEAIRDYRDDQLTLEQLEERFSSFASKVQGPMREIDALSPPPIAAEIHQTLTGGLAQCDKAIDEMDQWFETQDSGTKETTIVLVASCLDQVAKAKEELEKLLVLSQ